MVCRDADPLAVDADVRLLLVDCVTGLRDDLAIDDDPPLANDVLGRAAGRHSGEGDELLKSHRARLPGVE